MKKYRTTLIALFLFPSLVLPAQEEYPIQDNDYKTSWEEDYRGDDYITYTYYLENLGSEAIAFYNFSIKPNSDRYEVLQSYPGDVLILDPYQKSSYLQVKVYTNGPALTWNSKFMRYKDETSSYPKQNKDYVYYWKQSANSSGDKVYSYHLKNISDRNIRFYDYKLTNNGGEYYLVDNLLQAPVQTAPGECIQLVKYTYLSGEAPSVNWYADWTSFSPATGDDTFCSGLIKILESSKDGFSSVTGDLKNAANEDLYTFDTYYCNEHIDGLNNEAIEDLEFFYQYRGSIGSPASRETINSRFYDFKAKIESCLPDFPEKKTEEKDDSGYLKAEYEAEVDDLMHYIRLEVEYDIFSGDYRLDLAVEEVY